MIKRKRTIFVHKYTYGMISEEKIPLFEYIVYRLVEWYKEVVSNNQEKIDRHFSRLTTLKLLFFVSSIKDEQNCNKDLLDIFNKFYAMQYGPVEADVYTAIVHSKTKKYALGTRKLTICTPTMDFGTLNQVLIKDVDNAIDLLKKKNPQIISYNASQLINISHKWDAWKNAMGVANILGKGSEPMSIADIRANPQIYG